MGLASYNNLVYETDVLWLLQHLPATSQCNDVEELLQERFAEQQGSHQFDPENVLRMKALAADIFEYWNAYRQRNATSAFTQQTHARSRMRRLYYPAHR
jgi:hypothetical protein